MFFDHFADLTGSFNSAIGAGARIGALGVSVGTIFSLAADDKNRKDDMAPLKAVAKMSLMGMLF